MDSLKKKDVDSGIPSPDSITEEQMQAAIQELEDMGIDSEIAVAVTEKMLEVLRLIEACLERGDNDAARRLSTMTIPD